MLNKLSTGIFSSTFAKPRKPVF